MDSVVEITAPASSTALVELDTVKAELGITGTDEDARLNRLIAVAGDFVAGPEGLDREPWRQSYREQLPGRGGLLLHFERWPIETVAELKHGDELVDDTEYRVAGDRRDALQRVVDGDASGYFTWPKTPARRHVGMSGTLDKSLVYDATYTAGWTMPGVDPVPPEGTPLPPGIQEAALLLVIDWFRGGLQIPAGIESESFEGMRIQYRSTMESTPMTRAVTALLARWR